MRRSVTALSIALVLTVSIGWIHGLALSVQEAPGAPTLGIASPLGGGASITVTPRAGDTVTGYVVSAVPLRGPATDTRSVTISGTTMPLEIVNLANGTVYQLKVAAVNGGAVGPFSALSNTVVPSSVVPDPVDPTKTFILPTWSGTLSGSGTVSGGTAIVSITDLATRLRTEIGDGPRAKIGLSTFLGLFMNDYTDEVARVRDALASTMSTVDAALARADALDLPIGFSLVTAIRESVDGVETAAADEDWRNIQWYGDTTFTPFVAATSGTPVTFGTLARGQNGTGNWATFSQYARKMRRIKEVYVREFGTMLRERMKDYPDVFIAVTGDGEIEMTSDRFKAQDNPSNAGSRAWADYSPFAILEFRDWLRGHGLYAAGQPLAAEAYFLSSRYSGDDTAALARFNTDFGTSFTTWDLKHHHWSLSDPETAGNLTAVPTTCPVGQNLVAGFCVISGGFDAPRPDPATILSNTSRFWLTFRQFRDEMVHRYNRDFARWITEGSVTNGVYAGGVPFDRFYSAQVPTDVLFGSPAADGGVRHLTSGSPYWTADIWPYGGMGVTGYNTNANGSAESGNSGNIGGYYDRTVVHVAPLVVERLRSRGQLQRWSIVEWNPSDPWSQCANIYRADNVIIRQYRPSLLIPYKIDTSPAGTPNGQFQRVLDSGFVTGLKELMHGAAANAAPLNCTTPNLPQSVPQVQVPGISSNSGTHNGGRGGWLPIITWAPPAPIFQGTALSNAQLNATANVPGTFSYATAAADANALGTSLAAGTHTITATFTPTDSDYAVTTATQTILVRAASGLIRGRVTSEATGQPLSGVTVRAESAVQTQWGEYFREPRASTTTDGDGRYTLGPIPFDEYVVRFQASGFIEELFPSSSCLMVSGDDVNGHACFGAQSVSVSSGQTNREGIDATLKRLGRIEGTLVDTSGSGVARQKVGVDPILYGAGGVTVITDTNGSFVVNNAYPGTWLASYNRDTATAEVRPGETVQVRLVRTGTLSISGLVSGPSGALGGVVVGVYNRLGQFVAETTSETGSSTVGSYSVDGLVEGQYFVRTLSNPSKLANQVYPNTPCDGCSTLSGTTVAAGSTNINFTLTNAGTISGSVTSVGSTSVVGTVVQVLDAEGAVVATSEPLTGNTYQVDGLATGRYFVRTSNDLGFIDRMYHRDGTVECLACGVGSGSAVSVTNGATTGSVDFILTRGGSITGTVTDSASPANPLVGVEVRIFNRNNVEVRNVRTLASGVFTARGLPTDERYYVRTRNGVGFNDELYNDNGCVRCDPNAGVPVPVTAPSETSAIDFALTAGGWVVGRVTNAAGEGLPDAQVSIFTQTGNVPVGSGTTGPDGTYRTSAVPAGSYYARVAGTDTYIEQFFCTTPGTCAAAPGVAFGVQNGTETTGINFRLPTGGRISGTITGGGASIEGAGVEVFDVRGRRVATGRIRQSDGLYETSPGLRAGDYFVRTTNTGAFLGERYDDLPLQGDSTGGKRVGVVEGQTTADIDFALTLGGRITGSAVAGSDPVTAGRVRIFDAGGVEVATAPLQNGRFITDASLRPGEYFALAEAPGLLPQLHANRNCINCSPLSGDVITVTAGATTGNVDFTFTGGGALKGRVTVAGVGQPRVDVEIYDVAGRLVRTETTDENGRYETRVGLAPAQYRLRTRNSHGLIDRRFPDTPCGTCPMSAGATVAVQGGQLTPVDDITLQAGPRLQGTVTRASDGSRVSGVTVTVVTTAGVVATAVTDDVGEYQTGVGLPPETYFVRTTNVLGLIDEAHNDRECAPCDPTKATAVEVTTATVTVDFSLASAGGSIAGRVRSTPSGTPVIAGLRMTLYTAAGAIARHTYTDAAGDYQFSGLRAGRYYVGAGTSLSGQEMVRYPYLGEFYDDRPQGNGVHLATPIVVADGAAVTGRDFGLTPGVTVVLPTFQSIRALVTLISESSRASFVLQFIQDLQAFIGVVPEGVYLILQGLQTTVASDAIGAPLSRTLGTITATAGQVARLNLNIAACTPPAFSTTTLADGKAGVAYSRTVAATGGSGALTFGVTNGFLAPGLSLNAASGAITGTPSTSGTAEFTVSVSDSTGCSSSQDLVLTIAAADPVNATATPSTLRFGATKAGSGGAVTNVTAGQSVSLTFSGAVSPTWTVSSNQPWLRLSTTGGVGAGTFTASILDSTNALGASTSASATITVSGDGIANSPVTIPVSLTIDQSNGAVVGAPLGQVDTPVQNAGGVQGAIGVTGWVLDNIGVTGVKIYRNCLAFENQDNCQTIQGQSMVFIGDAAFLAGARPDVETAFSGTYPASNRAGWGYLMLTSMLPHVTGQQAYGGVGPLTIYAVATDVEGNQKILGRSSDPNSPDFATPTQITMANDSIAKPFGAIDTPAQGATVSGTFPNFGWVLTPDSNTTGGEGGDILVPTNGSTAVVYIDSVGVATVTYNQCRGNVGNPVPPTAFCNDDVANIFGNPTPQATFTTRTSNPTLFRNLDAGRGAIGSYDVNTSTMTNGLHTIAWGVRDSANREEGIGSRFFLVLNGGADESARPAVVRGRASLLAEYGPGTEGVWGRAGYGEDLAWTPMHADASGRYRARLAEQGRLQLWLGAAVEAGYLVAPDGTLRDLPVGSRLDGALFGWMPPVGYVGTYHLAFLRGGERIDVDVTVWPAPPVVEGEAQIRMHLDAATQWATSSFAHSPTSPVAHSPVRVQGWAFDPQGAVEAGIGAVHVWSRRSAGCSVRSAECDAPLFLGEATLDVARPDVARAFDDAPSHAGFQLDARLAPGTYEITAYVWNVRTGRWEDARTVTITVK